MKRFSFLLAAVMGWGLFLSAGFAGHAMASTVDQTVTASADLLQINGHPDFNGTYDNDTNGFLYVGMTYQEPNYTNIRNRSAILFDLGSQAGVITSATLELHVDALHEWTDGHPSFMEVYGSQTDSLVNADGAAFPSIGSETKTIYTPVLPFSPNQIIHIDVTNIVKEFTGEVDHKVTFVLKGNENDQRSGRYFIHSLESTHLGAQKPKLKLTYFINTPPTGSFSIQEGTVTNSPTVHLAASGNDVDAGDSISQMRFTEDPQNWPEWQQYAQVVPFTLSAGNGLKTIYMQMQDTYGGITQSVISQSILFDPVAPIGTVRINKDETVTNNPSVTLYLSADDGAGSGVAQMQFSNDSDSTWSDWEAYSPTKTWTLPAGDGTKSVNAKFRDAAGNVSTVSTDTILLDTAAPTGSIVINGGDASTHSETVTLTLSAHDAGNVTDMRFSNDNTGWSEWEAYTAGKQRTVPAGDGTKSVFVQFRDAAGNVSTTPFSDTIELITADTTAPIVTGVSEGGKYNTDVTISFNEGTATIDGSPYTGGTPYGVQGNHTLIVTDSAGNSTTVHFAIDKKVPTGSLLINWGAPRTNTLSVVLVLSANDGGGTGVTQVRFSNDNVNWSAWDAFQDSKRWKLSSGYGVKTVYAQFMDAAGNVSSNAIMDTVIFQA